MQQSQGRRLSRRSLALLLSIGCSSSSPSEVLPTSEDKASAGPTVRSVLPRAWTQVDRATPQLAGRFGPHEWNRCEGRHPCEALTWSPVDLTEPRPTRTILITPKRVWQTRPDDQRWRKRWNWVDPVLSACLGDGLSLHLDSPGVDKTLVEHSDGFWWTFAFDEAGPCELNGGLELRASADKGRSTALTAGRYPWGSPAAQGFATDRLTQAYDASSKQ